ncbi:MAG: EboA domain-containing protein [Bacteroidota bacterium]
MENITQELAKMRARSLSDAETKWFEDRLELIKGKKSGRDLFMTYSLIASKIPNTQFLSEKGESSEVADYLELHKATLVELCRIDLLANLLTTDMDIFSPKVSRIIEVADMGELTTFLKFLILLPNPEDYKFTAVEALRTNMTTVFNAIALNNPYPARYFNEQQWNQMYLKTAFMQGDLSAIHNIDQRANVELTRIISDYAHERWAASREIDPYFWRPVASFLNAELLKDMERLLRSPNPMENRAGALCCHASDYLGAKALLEQHPSLRDAIIQGKIRWDTLKETP